MGVSGKKRSEIVKNTINAPFLCGVTPLTLWGNPKGNPKRKKRGNTGVTPKTKNYAFKKHETNHGQGK